MTFIIPPCGVLFHCGIFFTVTSWSMNIVASRLHTIGALFGLPNKMFWYKCSKTPPFYFGVVQVSNPSRWDIFKSILFVKFTIHVIDNVMSQSDTKCDTSCLFLSTTYHRWVVFIFKWVAHTRMTNTFLNTWRMVTVEIDNVFVIIVYRYYIYRVWLIYAMT